MARRGTREKSGVPAVRRLLEQNMPAHFILCRKRRVRNERIVTRVQNERRQPDRRKPRLRRCAQPVVVRPGEPMERRGDELVECPHRAGKANARAIEPIRKQCGHRKCLGFQRAQECVGVNPVRALADRNAGSRQIERRRDCSGGAQEFRRTALGAAEPIQQRRTAEGNAHGVRRRLHVHALANRRQHRSDFLVVTRMISAR